MAATHRKRTALQSELRALSPERPANWPGGTHWPQLWDCLSAHVHAYVSVSELARREDVSYDRMLRWLGQARIMARRLGVA